MKEIIGALYIMSKKNQLCRCAFGNFEWQLIFIHELLHNMAEEGTFRHPFLLFRNALSITSTQEYTILFWI